MSIRYKLFGAFSVVLALACGLAFYGIRGISTSGDLVVRLFDGPLMAINHARSAHAALNDARLLMQRSLSASEPGESVAKIEKLLADIEDDLGVVRVRADNNDVSAALEQAEAKFRDWSASGLMIIKPTAAGHTALPLIFSIVQKGDATVAAFDDLVEIVAAYGFDYRREAEATVASARTNMVILALGTVLLGLIIAAVFAHSLSKPIFAAMHIAGRVAAGTFTDRIEVRRRDELGHLLKSLGTMQASLKARADQDLAVMRSKDAENAEQTSRRTRMEAEIEAFRSTITSVLANADAVTGELTETAQTLSSISQAAGQQSIEASSSANETSANVQTVSTAAGQLGESVQAIEGQLHEATGIVRRASTMAENANQTMGTLTSAAQRCRRLHPQHRGPNQLARSQCHYRSCPGGRSRPRLLGGCFRSEEPRHSDRPSDRRDFIPDRRSAVGNQASRRQRRSDGGYHERDRRVHGDHCKRRQPPERRGGGNNRKRSAGGRRNRERGPWHRRNGRSERECEPLGRFDTALRQRSCQPGSGVAVVGGPIPLQRRGIKKGGLAATRFTPSCDRSMLRNSLRREFDFRRCGANIRVDLSFELGEVLLEHADQGAGGLVELRLVLPGIDRIENVAGHPRQRGRDGEAEILVGAEFHRSQ